MPTFMDRIKSQFNYTNIYLILFMIKEWEIAPLPSEIVSTAIKC